MLRSWGHGRGREIRKNARAEASRISAIDIDRKPVKEPECVERFTFHYLAGAVAAQTEER